ncbi:MAG: YkgJ family cysteine cluster protein, partial [Anaerolineales bacterium]
MSQPDDYPYTFDPSACRHCGGACCRGSGGVVWITPEEMENMASVRKMDLETFADLYVRVVQGKLALQERRINGEFLCCFFDLHEAKCTIYPERPQQCRTYPFW